jgi:hypothetical protein
MTASPEVITAARNYPAHGCAIVPVKADKRTLGKDWRRRWTAYANRHAQTYNGHATSSAPRSGNPVSHYCRAAVDGERQRLAEAGRFTQLAKSFARSGMARDPFANGLHHPRSAERRHG